VLVYEMLKEHTSDEFDFENDFDSCEEGDEY
jgi:hypothetical protein